MKTLAERAREIKSEGVFLGGPLRWFEIAGRKSMATLLNEGLRPYSKVLDIGCGCLRIGYWLIHFLDKGCYFGIEPNTQMLDAGIRLLLEPGLLAIKAPTFSHNPNFDFTAFGQRFDFFLARSIWTHASKPQILAMLDGFVATATPNAVFITSYIKPNLLIRDYRGQSWVGGSHQSITPGIVAHSLRWIQSETARRGLVADEIKERTLNFGFQKWIRIRPKPP